MVKEALTDQQKDQIVTVMTAVASRCKGDSDEMVNMTGPELKSLVFAFGGTLERSQLNVLDTPEWTLVLREDWFIASKRPRALISNARQIQNIAKVVLEGERRRFRDSGMGLR